MHVRGKRILVTGASSGIGRACAKALSDRGAILRVSGRDEKRLDECLSGLSGEGHSAYRHSLDDIEGIDAWLDGIAGDGPLDGLVHSAGVISTKPIKAMGIPEYRHLMSVNLDAAFALSKAFRKKANHNPGASIVYISSVAGITGQSCRSAYGASKAALLGLCKSLAIELVPDRIRVNCVLPGFVRSEMFEALGAGLTDAQKESIERSHPLGLGEPEDVAYAVAFLLSDAARWITGSGLVVDGGFSAQ